MLELDLLKYKTVVIPMDTHVVTKSKLGHTRFDCTACATMGSTNFHAEGVKIAIGKDFRLYTLVCARLES